MTHIVEIHSNIGEPSIFDSQSSPFASASASPIPVWFSRHILLVAGKPVTTAVNLRSRALRNVQRRIARKKSQNALPMLGFVPTGGPGRYSHTVLNVDRVMTDSRHLKPEEEKSTLWMSTPSSGNATSRLQQFAFSQQNSRTRSHASRTVQAYNWRLKTKGWLVMPVVKRIENVALLTFLS